jgi:hypothetical protein
MLHFFPSFPKCSGHHLIWSMLDVLLHLPLSWLLT